ncbi:hypothetical protein ACFFSH_35270 [Streptomyces filamentosus]|uniref:Uncharacterized protein n=1 Tax=Streptomyces filamentosus TaxID=67294 RepID=A0A919BI58_STRFL|nr:hypothetical protein [Streptomyces filamentosus]GHF93128.1 hypothetical protein GCM10017667_23560 [Streptomyces filamentosus]
MFNRIRGALSRTRAQHRRTKSRRRAHPAIPARPKVIHLGQASQRLDARNWDVLAGEETALVRPYVTAAEKRARRTMADTAMLAGIGCWAPVEVTA